jgi:ketosteroid isomerase-like protein
MNCKNPGKTELEAGAPPRSKLRPAPLIFLRSSLPWPLPGILLHSLKFPHCDAAKPIFMQSKLLLFSAFILLAACKIKTRKDKPDNETLNAEVIKAENDFAKMAAEKGIAEAFWFFADSNAVIKRQRDTLIMGKENIRHYYSADYFKNASVTWAPDFVTVSEDGDLAYTYGKYTWQSKDSMGKINESNGIFHTVWKRQKDNTWRYVWD